jgi:threonine dehydrogenase-like Zn-dependent dehydrogenase
MTEPVSCCLHGIDLINISLGETVLIVGCGNIGLTMIQLCKYAGASNIIAVEPISHRRDLALQLGADYVFDSNNASVLSNVDLNQTGPITKAIDCAGLISTAEFCIENAGKGATVLLFGLTGPHDVLSVKPFSMFLKELTIKTSFVNPFTFERALNLLSNGIVKTSEIITDIYPLADIQEVFANRLYAKNGKVLIKCVSE